MINADPDGSDYIRQLRASVTALFLLMGLLGGGFGISLFLESGDKLTPVLWVIFGILFVFMAIRLFRKWFW